MPQQRRALRPFGVEPLQLVEMGMRVIEHAIGPSAEHARIARVIDSKPAHRHAVHHFRARRIVVAPRDIVARARRQHVDVGVLRQVLGDIAGMQLGAAVDVGAVALHHDSELHCAEGSGSSPESSLSDPASAGPSSKSVSGPSSSAASAVGSPCGGVGESSGDASSEACRLLPCPRPACVRDRRGVHAACGGAGAQCSTHSPDLPDSARPAAGCACDRLRRRRWRRARLLLLSIVLRRPRSRLLRLARRPGARPVLDDGFQRPCAPLVEVHPARQRFEPHLEVSILDADARQLQHEVVHELVIQHVDLVALLALFAEQVELLFVERVDLRLLVQHLDERVRIEEAASGSGSGASGTAG